MFVVKLSSCGDNLIVADRLFHTAGHGYPETECHHQGGAAFSLMTYREVQPRAVAIKEAVLSRRMPPWGAVKGFGDFRNDQGLTQEELEVITEWIESDAPRGNNPGVLPKEPKFETSPFKRPKDSFVVIGETTFVRPLVLDGILPEQIPEGASPQIVAVVPDGRVEPLVWFYEYKNSYQHPISLPGTPRFSSGYYHSRRTAGCRDRFNPQERRTRFRIGAFTNLTYADASVSCVHSNFRWDEASEIPPPLMAWRHRQF